MEALEQSKPRLVFDIAMAVKPFGKQRPRATKMGRIYTPKETIQKEDEIRYWIAQASPPLFDGAVQVICTFYFAKPKSVPKKVLHHTKTPDVDNLFKTVLDAMNGLVLLDDKQVVWAAISKKYADQDRIELLVTEAI